LENTSKFNANPLHKIINPLEIISGNASDCNQKHLTVMPWFTFLSTLEPFCLHWSWERFWVVTMKGCYISFLMN